MNQKPSEYLTCDILIIGGSFSAVATALSAARENPQASIILTEPTDWLGGQATSEGVSAIDNCWFEPGASLMRDNAATYYPKDYLQWIDMLWHKPVDAPGTGMAPYLAGWVSRETFDPRTGAWLLEKMICQYDNITYLPMTILKSLETVDAPDGFGADGKRISAVTLIKRTARNGYKPHTKLLSEEMHDWFDPKDSDDFSKAVIQIKAATDKLMVVVDASESASAVVLSGADYTVGREISGEMTQDDTQLPNMDEDASQATVFPFCMAFSDKEDMTLKSFLVKQYPNFEQNLARRAKEYFSFGKHNWKIAWTYRRIYCTGKTGMEDVNDDDVSMQNWYPGNDFPDASIYKNRKQVDDEKDNWQGGWHYENIAAAEEQAFAWFEYYKSKISTTLYPVLTRGNDPRNMMDTAHGLSRFPYIRCGRRIVGLYSFRITSNTLVDLECPKHQATSFRFYDSVGIGNYAIDIHPLTASKGITPPFEKAAPFYIPLRALASRNVRNLLASGKNMAATYITNSAYRLHPIEWASGSAVGVLAAFMQRENTSAYTLLALESLRKIQAAIAQNSPIHWAAYDATVIPNTNGDLLISDIQENADTVSFELDLFYPNADHAEIWAGKHMIGEGYIRKETGKMRLFNLETGKDNKTIKAKCFDKDNNLLETLVFERL